MTLTIQYNCVQLQKNSKILSYAKVNSSQLHDEFVLIKVHFSNYNNKDLLVAKGQEGSRRTYPHTLGLDAAGEVVESRSSSFKSGDLVAVMATQAGISMAGGYSEYLMVPASSISRIPETFTTREAMLFGTAGLTAALAVKTLISNPNVDKSKPVLVTGGSSGVGVVSAILLNLYGFKVTASTSNDGAARFLRSIGVGQVMNRIQNPRSNSFALLPEKWGGCIDIIGGPGLSMILKSISQGGKIISVGSLAGDRLEINLNPFYLRGVNLVGINTESLTNLERSELLSEFLTKDLSSILDEISLEHNLNQVPELMMNHYFGSNFGRHLIKI